MTWLDNVIQRQNRRDLNPPPSRKVEAVKPEVDDFEGENLAYRGLVDHGVPGNSTDTLDGVEGYHEGRPVEYLEEEKVVEPIPVRIVHDSGREVKAFRTAQFPVDSEVRLLIGRNEQIYSVKIKNGGNNALWISDTMAMGPNVGSYGIAPGADVEVENGPVYVVAAVGNPTTAHTLTKLTEKVK